MTQTTEEVLRRQQQDADAAYRAKVQAEVERLVEERLTKERDVARHRAASANRAAQPKAPPDTGAAHDDAIKSSVRAAPPPSTAGNGPAAAAAPPSANNPPVASDGGVVARTGDARSIVDAYLDTVAPAGLHGREINFKEGKFTLRDDGEEVSGSRVFVALVEQLAVGLIHFHGKGNPPDVHMALIYEGQLPPARGELGETEESQWPTGLSGKPEDPWCPQNYLPLEDPATKEAFTFVTRNSTGIRAVGNLMRQYGRLRKTHPDMYPLINLKVGGFNHRDERIGWVTTPHLTVVGRHPRDSAAKPDSSLSADMNDKIPDHT